QACSSGTDAEMRNQGYHGVPVIRGFRYVSEIGGGCVMALIDQAEAFAPTDRLRTDLAGISISLAGLAIACSFLFALLVPRPMSRLRGRARLRQAGDFVSPVPVGGPAEVQTFAATFAGMADSLKESRLALEETTERLRNILDSIAEGFMAVDR